MVRMRALLRANLDRQGTWLSATGVVNGRVPGSMAEVSEPGLLLTLRWRGVDSNHQFRVSRHRCPHVCRFLDAEMTRAPRTQAAGVQKAPRHEVAGSLATLGRERYGDLIFAPAMMVDAMLAPDDLDGCEGGLEACNGHLGGRVDRINGRSAR